MLPSAAGLAALSDTYKHMADTYCIDCGVWHLASGMQEDSVSTRCVMQLCRPSKNPLASGQSLWIHQCVHVNATIIVTIIFQLQCAMWLCCVWRINTVDKVPQPFKVCMQRWPPHHDDAYHWYGSATVSQHSFSGAVGFKSLNSSQMVSSR